MECHYRPEIEGTDRYLEKDEYERFILPCRTFDVPDIGLY